MIRTKRTRVVIHQRALHIEDKLNQLGASYNENKLNLLLQLTSQFKKKKNQKKLFT